MSTPVSIVTQTDTSTTVVATETSTRTTTETASYPTPTKYSNPCKQVYAQFYNIDAPFYDYEVRPSSFLPSSLDVFTDIFLALFRTSASFPPLSVSTPARRGGVTSPIVRSTFFSLFSTHDSSYISPSPVYLATARITPGDTSGGASHCWCKQRAAVAALADPGYRQKYGDPQRVNMVRATCAELTQVLGGADVGCQDVTFTIDDF